MIYKAPENISKRDINKNSVFLAGSIEMGKAIDWQTELGEFFHKQGWDVFNPRRDDWNSTWKQEYDNPQFYQQTIKPSKSFTDFFKILHTKLL